MRSFSVLMLSLAIAVQQAAAAEPSVPAEEPHLAADPSASLADIEAGPGEARLELQLPSTGEPAVDRPRLRVGKWSAATVAAGALVLWGASEIERANDEVTGCRWCEPGRFDLWVRDELRWGNTASAGKASDVLLLAVPLASAATVASLGAYDRAGAREIVEDVLVVAAAVLVTDPLTAGVKHAAARLRPQPWAAGGALAENDLHSFFSGHTSRVFTAAAAAAQVTRLRHRPGWKWVAAAGFTAAAATGWLRIGADQHWATDVLAGAAVGAATGFGVATVALRPSDGPRPAVTLVPAPGGFALLF